jgi:hypothetical protein
MRLKMGIIHSIISVVCNIILIIYLAAFVLDILARMTPVSKRLIPPSQQATLDILVREMATPSRTTRITTFLQIPQVELAWPILVKKQSLLSTRTNNLEYNAGLQLRPLEVSMAGFNLVLLGAVTVMGQLNLAWHILLLLTVAAILVAIVSRHISYLLGSLPERFRRSASNPYRSYVILAACDALSLLLSISLLRSWNHQFHLSWPIVKSSALDLFTLRQISEIASTHNHGEALISLIGLLFYSAILKTIVNLEQFKRTDDDLRALATSNIMMADFGQARKWLSQEQQRTSASFDLRARIELAAGNFSKAADQVRDSLRLSDKDDDPDSVNRVMSVLSFAAPMSLQLRISYVRYIINSSRSDILTLLAIDNSIVGLRPPSESQLKLSVEAKEYAQLLADCPEEDYPLSRARLMAMNEDFEEAIGILERAQPGSEVEEIIRLTSACIFECANPNVNMDHTRSYVERWLNESLPVVKDLSAGVPVNDRPVVVSFMVLLSNWLDFLEIQGSKAVLDLATPFADSAGQLQRMNAAWHGILRQ